MINLTAKSREYLGALVVLLLLAVATGVYFMLSMPTGVYPEVAFPRIAVIAELPGTAVQTMEISVTRPLENAVSTVVGVTRVQSKTIRGSSELSVIFSPESDMQTALHNTRGRIATLAGELPKDLSLVIEQQTPSVFPVISLNLSGGTSPTALRDYALYSLRPLLMHLPDVANITVTGGELREISIEVDPDLLAAAGLSIAEFAQQVSASSELQAVGQIDHANLNFAVLGNSLVTEPGEISRLPVTTRSGAALHVADFARVRMWHGDRTQGVSGMNGRRERVPAVSVSLFRRLGGNTLTVANALDAELKRLRPRIPANIEIQTVYNQASFIRDSVANVRDAIVIGGLGSVVVLLLFLRSWRATLISAVAIPLSLVITFIFLYFTRQTLNLMSLGGLAVAIGLIIDDTVVVIENICRHLTDNSVADRVRTVDLASREITGAVVGSTLTTVAVFVPLAFISGMVGQFFTALSVALCTAILVSMVLSLTLIPVAASRLLPAGSVPEPGRIFNAFAWLYEQALAVALRFRWPAMALALAAVPALWFVSGRLPSSLLPEMDEGTFILDYFLPDGTSLTETERFAAEIEDQLRENPWVTSYTRRTGAENGFFATQMFHGDFTVVLADRDHRVKGQRRPSSEDIMSELREYVHQHYPESRVRVETVQVIQDELKDLAGASKSVEIKILGPNYAVLKEFALKAAEILESREVKDAGLAEVDSHVHQGYPDLLFAVDNLQATQVGLSTAAIQDQVRTALFGKVVNTVPNSERLLDVRVRLPPALRGDLDGLQQLPITTPAGKIVPLGQLVSFRRARSPAEIWRENQQPGINVTGDLENNDKLGAVIAAVRPKLQELEKSLPVGYRIELAGQYESQRESFRSLSMMLILATGLVFMLLAFQFRSLLLPLLIFMTQPLSLLCAAIGLWITGTPLNMSSYMGAILLIGLDVKNGIILIEYIEQLRAEGWELMPALLHAGRIRFRPILMTSLAAVIGLAPLAINWGGGPGAQMQQPLAIAVIGGLLANMFFTRMVIPVGYLCFHPRRASKAS